VGEIEAGGSLPAYRTRATRARRVP